MKAYTGKILICLLPVLVACGIVGWAFYEYTGPRKGGFRLGVDLVGGTVLVYQVDPTKLSKDSHYSVDDLIVALKRRIDPNDLKNVTIRPIAGSDPQRIEIILPGGRGKESDDYIARVRGDISQQGLLEFRILANTTDDPDGIRDAKAVLEDKGSRRLLKDADENGQPPPGPHRPNGEPYHVTINGEPGDYQYAWVELGKEELYNDTIRLYSGAAQDERSKAQWQAVEADRNAGRTFSIPGLSGCLLYSREIATQRLRDLDDALKANHLATLTELRAKHPNESFQKIREQEKDWAAKFDDLAQKDPDKFKVYEYFVLSRVEADKNKVVTGDFLDSVRGGINDKSQLTVDFALNAEGGNRFADLTYRNRPVPKETGFRRHLAIVMDGKVTSAPVINETIRNRGQISGNFSQTEIDTLVRILRAGALPATIDPKPVGENTMGATLGADTIRKGTYSVAVAFVAVLAFMAVYYRFAGLVACFALLANLVLTVAFMVVVGATFTLAGLAGLVLMLGMAVDANVLIYERLREERERGASLAMAIRNGYDRAFPTIIDTHLSSIFTAVVLYVVGNDTLKGFGISLTVGLVISLFTSLYITRTIFDIWMGMGWLKNLRFMQLFHRPNIDFMAIRYYWFTATIVLTVLGGALFLYRLDPKRGGLNIDFVGGTLYTGQLTQMVDIDTLRQKLRGADDELGGDLSIEQRFVDDPQLSQGGKSKIFNVLTTDRDSNKVQKVVNEHLGGLLKTVALKWETLDDQVKQTEAKVRDFRGDSSEKQQELDRLKEQNAMHKELLAQLAERNQTGYYLYFTALDDPTQSEDASVSRVRNMLQDQFHDKGLVAGTWQLIADPAQPVKEGRTQAMILEVTDRLSPAETKEGLAAVDKTFKASPQPDRLENFDAQMADSTKNRALVAIVLSWGALMLYLWFRFGNWTFGAAAVACLVHDLFFTLGMIAACHYVHLYVPWLANILLLQDFKIDLATVAALLTLVGYSVSDTIVVFDRIREVRGKNPALTPQMINDSVNQTLSRTVLSALSVWLVVFVLYVFGGEGVHLFAFVMVVGVIVGTYSSIYIASPLLLIFGEGVPSKPGVPQRAPQPARA